MDWIKSLFYTIQEAQSVPEYDFLSMERQQLSIQC